MINFQFLDGSILLNTSFHPFIVQISIKLVVAQTSSVHPAPAAIGFDMRPVISRIAAALF